MAAALTLTSMGNLDKVAPLVAAFHAEKALTTTEPQLTHILEGAYLGALYLIGPRVASFGYVVVAHGFSIEFDRPDAFIEETYFRPPVRGKGIGGESLLLMCKILEASGTKAMHLEVDQTKTIAQQLYSQGGFGLRANYNLMSKELH